MRRLPAFLLLVVSGCSNSPEAKSPAEEPTAQGSHHNGVTRPAPTAGYTAPPEKHGFKPDALCSDGKKFADALMAGDIEERIETTNGKESTTYFCKPNCANIPDCRRLAP